MTNNPLFIGQKTKVKKYCNHMDRGATKPCGKELEHGEKQWCIDCQHWGMETDERGM